ncbi:hypothetical protein L2E82_19408 [Cichorium intybus]|uniref:Uncharacterized protein n=1 Tax=Cichorium intybus TaxID=13427 RepID=A0ACB9FCG9_CICIN|nr:hypothetical protein L2E82_19408 [Cichorium intybus]
MSRMTSWVSFMAVLLCFSINGVADARHRKHLHPAAIVVGTVYCDTCFRQEVSKPTHFISGAKVAVECGGDGEKQSFRVEVKTNEKGEFEAKLPVTVGKSEEKIKACSVRLISSSEPYCAVAASATSSEIRFKSKKAGTHVFSAGFFTFKPELCNQKDFIGKGFPPSLPDPPVPFLPPVGGGILPPLPVPDLPIPSLVPPLPGLPGVPPLPGLPGVPLPPVTRQKSLESNKLTDQKTFGFPFPPPLLPPLPFVPSPPSSIPPVIPSPPPSLFPPVFPSPPSSLFPPLPFPPVPGLIPSPPPPPPAFPIPLPPLPPLPPVPGFPTVPPAKTSP